MVVVLKNRPQRFQPQDSNSPQPAAVLNSLKHRQLELAFKCSSRNLSSLQSPQSSTLQASPLHHNQSVVVGARCSRRELQAIVFLASSHSSSSPTASPSRINPRSQSSQSDSRRRTTSSLSTIFCPGLKFELRPRRFKMSSNSGSRLKTFRKKPGSTRSLPVSPSIHNFDKMSPPLASKLEYFIQQRHEHRFPQTLGHSANLKTRRLQEDFNVRLRPPTTDLQGFIRFNASQVYPTLKTVEFKHKISRLVCELSIQ
ncbi:hypothetical protein C8F01DRAFT_1075704 [Mycena amicta]|nr:hypothetical protein C8F01DRAFT_1075704 [Mycena amicta]